MANPEYRRLDGQVRSKRGILHRRLAAFSALNFKGEIKPAKVEAFEQQKAELQEEIEQLNKALEKLKGQRKEVKHHITLAELPDKEPKASTWSIPLRWWPTGPKPPWCR